MQMTVDVRSRHLVGAPIAKTAATNNRYTSYDVAGARNIACAPYFGAGAATRLTQLQ